MGKVPWPVQEKKPKERTAMPPITRERVSWHHPCFSPPFLCRAWGWYLKWSPQGGCLRQFPRSCSGKVLGRLGSPRTRSSLGRQRACSPFRLLRSFGELRGPFCELVWKMFSSPDLGPWTFLQGGATVQARDFWL